MDKDQFEAIMCMLQAIMLQQRALLALTLRRRADADEDVNSAWSRVRDAEEISGFKIP